MIPGRRTIPIAVARDPLAACEAAEPFALLVLGDSMAPEFVEGDVIVVEPEGLATEGAFVLAQVADGWIFRQLRASEGGWRLVALHEGYPVVALPDLAQVRGVVIQRSRRGPSRSRKRY